MGMETVFIIDLAGRSLEVTPLLLFGLVGNALFTARSLVQWISSERMRRSVVPRTFWWLSCIAVCVLITYAYARRDLPMVLGLSATLLPYVRNLRLQYGAPGARSPLRVGVVAALFCLLPLTVLAGSQVASGPVFALGLAGNALFHSRFFLQWFQSEVRGESVLTISFWYLSLVGTSLLFVYSLLRADPVFVLSTGFAIVPISRNIVLIHRRPTADAASASRMMPALDEY